MATATVNPAQFLTKPESFLAGTICALARYGCSQEGSVFTQNGHWTGLPGLNPAGADLLFIKFDHFANEDER